MAYVTAGSGEGTRKRKPKARRPRGKGPRAGRRPQSGSTYNQIVGKITNAHSVSAGGGRRTSSSGRKQRYMKSMMKMRMKGRRRSTKPGIRKGITGRTYSGTPMNRAKIKAAVAAYMKKKKQNK